MSVYYDKGGDVKPHLSNWKDVVDFTRKLLTLLNSYTPNEIRQYCLGGLLDISSVNLISHAFPEDLQMSLVQMLFGLWGHSSKCLSHNSDASW